MLLTIRSKWPSSGISVPMFFGIMTSSNYMAKLRYLLRGICEAFLLQFLSAAPFFAYFLFDCKATTIKSRTNTFVDEGSIKEEI